MDKTIFTIITLIFLIVAIFFREQTGIKITTIVVISLVLFGTFMKIFVKKD